MKEKNKEINFSDFRYKPFKFIFFVAKQKKWFGIVAIVCIIIAGVIQALIYPLIGDITDSLSEVTDATKSVYFLFSILVIALIAKNIFYRSSGFFAAHWISFIEIFAAQVAFDYLLGHSATYF